MFGKAAVILLLVALGQSDDTIFIDRISRALDKTIGFVAENLEKMNFDGFFGVSLAVGK